MFGKDLHQRGGGFGPLIFLTFLLFLLLPWVASAAAAAEPPKFLARFPDNLTKGDGANQLAGPRALATGLAGELYVAESGNSRISEFTPWGEFVKAWGWGVKDGQAELQVCGPPEPEVAPPPSLCTGGIAGFGAGQMANPNGVAVDSSGDIYVLERVNARVQKFNPAGQFLLMFGGEVDKTTGENVCTAASGDVCGVGVEGTGDGQFDPFPDFIGSYIAVASDDTVYVGDKGRIQAFEPDGAFKGNIPLPEPVNAASLVLDPSSGDLYVGLYHGPFDPDPRIFRLDAATGAVLDTLPIEFPPPEAGKIETLATDGAGDVFASLLPAGADAARVLEFGPSGEALLGFDDGFAAPAPTGVFGDRIELLGLATNSVGDVYVAENGAFSHISSVSAYGPPPVALAPPPQRPPTIAEQFATSVDTTGAVVKARINPHFFDDTTYFVEYGTASCDANPCAVQPTPPGPLLTGEVVNALLTTGGVSLQGLEPGTTYHYRFVAQSSGGGPVQGLAGKAGAEGEAIFTTPAVPPKQPACPANQAFRPGPGAFLPDCRAYEMVSPVDKNGADISAVLSNLEDPAALDQAAVNGEKLSYSAYRAFGEVESSPYASQYLAVRAEGVGWTSKGISPPRKAPSFYETHQLDSQYKGFSADLCQGWLLQDTEVALSDTAFPGFPNLYRRDNCGDGYEALAPKISPSVIPSELTPELQGFSADGSKAIFVAKGKLTGNASQASQLYEASEGQLRLVCIRPNNTAITGSCSAGTAGGQNTHPDRSATVSHAISDDGSKIYWTEELDGKLGKLFVRVTSSETILVNGGKAQFWTAAADGSKAIYSVGQQAFEFDLASKSSSPIAQGFLGVVGTSEDASKVYLVSTEDLGAGASLGKPNLYLYEAGEPASLTFIATFSEADVDPQNELPSSVATSPIRHVARATPDGGTLAFMSSARLTGYDNTDAASGQADSEVFLYRAGAETLSCASCLASAARPGGRDVKREVHINKPFWAAAQLPVAQSQVHFPRVLSDDGSRLFFESFDPLVLRDVNSQKDVYEWELLGSGNCTEAAPGFNAAVAGCVNLISSGESPQDSEIVDTSPDGRDVFFKTASSLLPQDPGLVDIYDARVGGGLPLAEPAPPECEGEACQQPASPPNDSTPSSRTFHGPGDPVAKPKPHRKKHKKKRHRRHHQHPRASR